jgi:hypothetical protein
MDSAVPSHDPSPPIAERPQSQPQPIDEMMRAYVSYLAGWFDIAQLAAGRELERSRKSLRH